MSATPIIRDDRGKDDEPAAFEMEARWLEENRDIIRPKGARFSSAVYHIPAEDEGEQTVCGSDIRSPRRMPIRTYPPWYIERGTGHEGWCRKCLLKGAVGDVVDVDEELLDSLRRKKAEPRSDIPIFDTKNDARANASTGTYRYSFKYDGFTTAGLDYCPVEGCDYDLSERQRLDAHLRDEHGPEDFGLSPIGERRRQG